MQDQKKLRDALKAIEKLPPGTYGDAWGSMLKAKTIAAEALSDTTEETEMEKLIRLLKTDVQKAVASGGIVEGHWADFCNHMIERITTQFGYGEEEGDAADREGD